MKAFHDKSPFLYIYGVDSKRWADKFGIEPVIAPCQNCKRIMETSLAFVYGPFRGLAINCPCGSHVPYCFVRAVGSLFDQ